LAVLVGWASSAAGHAEPPPIELWGFFNPGAQSCLRRISRATHACFDTVFALEQACRDAPLRGASCHQEELQSAISAADGELRRTLADSCAEGELTELSYIGFFDAGADLNRGCVGEAQAAIAARDAPARAGAR
jgi:hypothetical protein